MSMRRYATRPWRCTACQPPVTEPAVPGWPVVGPAMDASAERRTRAHPTPPPHAWHLQRSPGTTTHRPRVSAKRPRHGVFRGIAAPYESAHLQAVSLSAVAASGIISACRGFESLLRHEKWLQAVDLLNG